MRRQRTVSLLRLAPVLLIVLMLFPARVSAFRYAVAQREGNFLVFVGADGQVRHEATEMRLMYTDEPHRHYYTEAKLNDGRWFSLDKENEDIILEVQTFNPTILYRLSREMPLYSMPFNGPSYRLGRMAIPGEYPVSKKAYDFIELQLGDGQSGWIQVPENGTDLTGTQPGVFIDQPLTLDHRTNLQITVEDRFAPEISRVQTIMVPEYVTVHNASNFRPHADALWHANQHAALDYLPGVTYHYAVDHKAAYLLTPLNEATYNAGDRYLAGNGASVAIEICDHDDGKYYPQAEQNGAKLAAAILYQLGLPKENLRFHKDWSGKDCPYTMIRNERGSIGVEAFVERVETEYEALVMAYGAAVSPFKTASAPPSNVTRPESVDLPDRTEQTIMREVIVVETREDGVEETKVVMEVVNVSDLADHGALPYVAAGVFGLTVLGGIFYAVRQSKKRSGPKF